VPELERMGQIFGYHLWGGHPALIVEAVVRSATTQAATLNAMKTPLFDPKVGDCWPLLSELPPTGSLPSCDELCVRGAAGG